MMRIGQVRLREVAAMALANDTAVKHWRRLRRARGAERLASALARCASQGRPGGVIARAQGLPPTSRLKPQQLQVPPGKPDRQLCAHR